MRRSERVEGAPESRDPVAKDAIGAACVALVGGVSEEKDAIIFLVADEQSAKGIDGETDRGFHSEGPGCGNGLGREALTEDGIGLATVGSEIRVPENKHAMVARIGDIKISRQIHGQAAG